MIQNNLNQTNAGKPYIWVTLFYALLVLLFFYPVLQGFIISQTDFLNFISPWDSVKALDLLQASNPHLQDQSTEFLPFFLEAKRQFSAGLFPLWNPYIFAGNPLWANTQSALLFPLNIFHYLLAAPLGFTVSSLLKLYFGCLFTHLFIRKLGVGHGAALFGGVAFGFCSFTVFWLNHPHTNVTPLIPLCFYMVERLLDKPSTKNVFYYALVVALTLIAGHVEIAFLTAAACGLYYLIRLIQTNQLSSKALLRLLWVYVYGLLLSAILIFPFIEFLFNTAVWSERGDAVQFSIPTAGIINLFMGEFFIFDGWDKNNIGYHAFSPYVGVVALPLALYAIVKSFKQSLPLLVLTLLSVAVAFTIEPFHWLVKNLPLFNHLPLFYFSIIVAFGLSVLAALGLHHCLSESLDKEKIWVVLIILMLALLGIALFWQPGGLTQYVQDPERLVGSVDQVVGWIAVVLLSTCLLMSFANKFKKPALIVLITALFVDLWLIGHDWNPAIPAEISMPSKQPGSLAFLSQQDQPFRTVGYDYILKPSTNMLAQIHDVRGYDVPVIDRYHQFFNQALEGKDAFWYYDLPVFNASILPFLDTLNVKYLLSKKSLDTQLPDHLELVYDDEIRIYENHQAQGLAYFAADAIHVSTEQAALAKVLALKNQLDHVVVLEVDKPNEAGVLDSDQLSDPVQSIVYRNITAQSINLQVTTSRAAWLVISQAYYPGWVATIDGEETEIIAANYVLQAIKIPAGAQHVSLTYQPFSFTLGWVVSLLSLLLGLWKIRKIK